MINFFVQDTKKKKKIKRMQSAVEASVEDSPNLSVRRRAQVVELCSII